MNFNYKNRIYMYVFRRLLSMWVLPPNENTKQKDQEDVFCPSYWMSHEQCCEGSDVDSFTDRGAQSYRAAAARTRTLTSAVLFGAFLKTAALVQSHAHIGHAVYARAGHSFPTSNAPFIRDILLPSECLASLSSVFKREFNRRASFTKTPYKKILKMLHYAYKNMHD